MALVTIPEKLEDWKIETINELIKYTGIESENFDFKKEPNEITKHICAFANTVGGFIVLGVEEIRGSDSTTIAEFKKVGFTEGKQDSIRLQVGNNVSNLEPIPTVNLVHLSDGQKFFTVIKIENEITKKPVFLRNTGQCYVRIQNSSQLASRTTMANLFSTSMTMKSDVEKIRTACLLVKESLLHTSNENSSAHPASSMKIPMIDLTFLREAILSAEWFLKEKDLFGRHTGDYSYTEGITSIMHRIELMNTYIEAYNRATNEEERRALSHQLDPWKTTRSSLNDIVKFLDKVNDLTTDFLSKY